METQWNLHHDGIQTKDLLDRMRSEHDKEFQEDLFQLVSLILDKGEVNELTVLAFPVLYDILLQKEDINEIVSLLDVLGMSKVFLHQIDLYSLPMDTYLAYWDTVFLLQNQMPNLMNPKLMRDLDQDSKSTLALTYLSIMDPWNESLPFQVTDKFDHTFSLTCPHCLSIIKNVSLFANDSGTNAIMADSILKQDPFHPPVQNLHGIASRFLKALKEEYLSSCLPLVYGHMVCPYCQETIPVMDSIIDYLKYETQFISQPQEDEINFLRNHAGTILYENTMLALSYFTHALIILKMLHPEETRKEAIIYDELAVCYRLVVDNEKEKQAAQSALEIFQRLKEEDSIALAQAHMCLGFAIHQEDLENERKDHSLALSHFEKALEIFSLLQKEDSEDIRFVKENIAKILSEENQEKGLSMLKQELQELLDKQANPSDIAECQESISSIYQQLHDYRQAIYHHDFYLNHMIQTYGENSEAAAECYLDTASLYQDAKDFEIADQYYQKALLILEEPLQKGGDIVTLASCFFQRGICLYQMNQPKEAFAMDQKALTLLDQNQIPNKEKGDILQHMGEILTGTKEKETAISCYERALQMYKDTQEFDIANAHPILLQEADECDAEIQKVYEILKKLKKEKFA